MTGDYMTKPLQGSTFKKFRDQIMGVVPAQDPGPGKVQKRKKTKQMKENKKVKFGLAPGE